jgi:ubiquitin-conjugating enzyme E2 H
LEEYVKKYASKEAVDEADNATDDDDEMSSAGEYESDEDEAAGMEDL